MMRIAIATLLAATLVGASPREQRFVDAVVAQTAAPAAVIAVRTAGRTHVAAAGLADARAKTPARPGDRVWIGSVSKTFTAALVLQLASAGRLSLGDTVGRWLPDAGRAARSITIAELLGHRSGLPDYLDLPSVRAELAARPRAVVPVDRLIRMATRVPLEFA